MITYKLCSENDLDPMFEAFTKGFSDYMIKFELTKEQFKNLFLGIEGNAKDDFKPVGIMLGGIKTYDGLKTLRCGTLAIDPDYRRKGVAQELFNRHHSIGVKENCQQLFLEVIKGNDKAIHFYLKQGYEIKNDIFYYQLKDASLLNDKETNSYMIKSISFENVNDFYHKHDDKHLNWQNDFDYQKQIKEMMYYGSFDQDQLIGVLSMTPNGKIFYLFVHETFRRKGIATSLLHFAKSKANFKSINISVTHKPDLMSYLEKQGFVLQSISQHEMYVSL